MSALRENHVEHWALEELAVLGYAVDTGSLEAERDPSLEAVVLEGRLMAALARLNPTVPPQGLADACAKVRQMVEQAVLDLMAANEGFHKLLTEGVPVAYTQAGEQKSQYVRLLDFEQPEANAFLAVNQFTVRQGRETKRPDILLFVNGMPLVVLELKNPASEQATLERAYNQVETYKATVSRLFAPNVFSVISDGTDARAGTLSADLTRFAAWKSVDGLREASHMAPQLHTLMHGMLQQAVLLELVRSFVTFEKVRHADAAGLVRQVTVKKLAAYHQYYAVRKAVERTVEASGEGGDRRGGVVWHTQGSGKSLSMVFFAGKLVLEPAMRNPTIVVITDRNDLDNQLFDTFSASTQLLRQPPLQAQNRADLREKLRRAGGGIVFTTIQKFSPDKGDSHLEALSDRRNIVVVADEAHRTQYGFEGKLVEEKNAEGAVVGQQWRYGFAKYLRDALPNATYIGFTGTPIESEDVSTRQVFGNYIDIYDISQAVEDGATVKIYYESRLAKVNLSEEGRRLVEEFDRELDSDQELSESQRAKAKWTQLEAIVGHPERINNLARDIVGHFEQRESALAGKGMIVAMSRRIAADLYAAIVALRPDWNSTDLTQGGIKVVMTASSDDGPEVARHMTTKEQRELLADRVRDPADPLKLVIVRDMWLTGFDAPCLHTLYVDKPMRGHNLMQAIARVNRVFKDKPGGLVVDYLGIATDLKKALKFYADAGGRGEPAETQGQAVELMLEKLDVVRALFTEKSRHRSQIVAHEPAAYFGNERLEVFNTERFFEASTHERLGILLQATEHILGLEKGKERFVREVTVLSQAFALSIPDVQALAVKEEVAFYQAVKARLLKFDAGIEGASERPQPTHDYSNAIKQIVDQSLESEEVVDIFQAAGMERPEISILSEQFLDEVRNLRHKNLALELLKKLLNDEIKKSQRSNVVKSQELLKMLETSVRRYQNNLISTAEIIQELIEIAHDLKRESDRANQKGLSPEELAFYDALRDNDTVREVLADDRLVFIAREVAEQVRQSRTIDWNLRESARAQVIVAVKRTLRKYGYPPEKQEHAVEMVLKQASLMAEYLQ